MRERLDEKAVRLLAERRLRVELVEPGDGRIRATCRGDAATYDLGWDPERGRWACTCPAFGGCSHLLALMLVVVQERSA